MDADLGPRAGEDLKEEDLQQNEEGDKVLVVVRVKPFDKHDRGGVSSLADSSDFPGISCGVKLKEGASSTIVATSPQGRVAEFSYDRVFWHAHAHPTEVIDAHADQRQVYKALGPQIVKLAWRGLNASIFSYGQTGSGKTHTMMGSSKQHGQGLIPRICQALFKSMKEFEAKRSPEPSSPDNKAKELLDCQCWKRTTSKNGEEYFFNTRTKESAWTLPEGAELLKKRHEKKLSEKMISGHMEGEDVRLRVEVSYIEIYNEVIVDLLVDPGPSGAPPVLRTREHPKYGPYAEGAQIRKINSWEGMSSLLREGSARRATAATSMNDRSSRSHAILQVSFIQTTVQQAGEQVKATDRLSKLSMVDLAGSERADKTEARGQRLVESGSINRSLLTLGRVINALSEAATAAGSKKKAAAAQHIPYRNSVLTWLLKESLGGNARTVMVATISPSPIHFEETMSTLRYAERAKRITTHAVVNEDPNIVLIRQLRQEIERLRAELKQKAGAAGGEGNSVVTVDPEMMSVLAALKIQNRVRAHLLQKHAATRGAPTRASVEGSLALADSAQGAARALMVAQAAESRQTSTDDRSDSRATRQVATSAQSDKELSKKLSASLSEELVHQARSEGTRLWTAYLSTMQERMGWMCGEAEHLRIVSDLRHLLSAVLEANLLAKALGRGEQFRAEIQVCQAIPDDPEDPCDVGLSPSDADDLSVLSGESGGMLTPSSPVQSGVHTPRRLSPTSASMGRKIFFSGSTKLASPSSERGSPRSDEEDGHFRLHAFVRCRGNPALCPLKPFLERVACMRRLVMEDGGSMSRQKLFKDLGKAFSTGSSPTDSSNEDPFIISGGNVQQQQLLARTSVSLSDLLGNHEISVEAPLLHPCGLREMGTLVARMSSPVSELLGVAADGQRSSDPVEVELHLENINLKANAIPLGTKGRLIVSAALGGCMKSLSTQNENNYQDEMRQVVEAKFEAAFITVDKTLTWHLPKLSFRVLSMLHAGSINFTIWAVEEENQTNLAGIHPIVEAASSGALPCSPGIIPRRDALRICCDPGLTLKAIQGIYEHHRGDTAGTHALVSRMGSPPPVPSPFLPASTSQGQASQGMERSLKLFISVDVLEWLPPSEGAASTGSGQQQWMADDGWRSASGNLTPPGFMPADLKPEGRDWGEDKGDAGAAFWLRAQQGAERLLLVRIEQADCADLALESCAAISIGGMLYRNMGEKPSLQAQHWEPVPLIAVARHAEERALIALARIPPSPMLNVPSAKGSRVHMPVRASLWLSGVHHHADIHAGAALKIIEPDADKGVMAAVQMFAGRGSKAATGSSRTNLIYTCFGQHTAVHHGIGHKALAEVEGAVSRAQADLWRMSQHLLSLRGGASDQVAIDGGNLSTTALPVQDDQVQWSRVVPCAESWYPPSHEGFLLHRTEGQRKKQWNRCWCVLRRPQLCLYKSKGDAQPAKSMIVGPAGLDMDVEWAELIVRVQQPPASLADGEASAEGEEPREVWVLQASNEADMERWMRELGPRRGEELGRLTAASPPSSAVGAPSTKLSLRHYAGSGGGEDQRGRSSIGA
jgi:hypothetical protein